MATNFMQRLGERWDEREEGLESAIVHSSLKIAAETQVVWDFVVAPESALLLGDQVVKAFRVPHTPTAQPGEQICVVTEDDGRLSVGIIETVALEPREFLLSRWLTGPTELLEKTTLTPTGQGGTTITLRLAMRVELGTARQVRPLLERHVSQTLRRLRAAVESGVKFPQEQPLPPV
ncbi:hypothetical protein [Knoellia sp. Soil729]|uniref:hypothetical protein n=1 Tax=Knoellia sp. Soil729 TaxID=1736394 RepID=UPI0012E7E69E|nr:hypothetical protein [Knoellia sp. Soil729]